MGYADLDKRRKTTRERVRRYRERQKQAKGVTSGVTQGVTSAMLDPVRPKYDADGNPIPEY